MAEKWELATAFIGSHPALELRLVGRKAVDFWIGTEAPARNFRETDSVLIRGILLSSFFTGVGALAGIFVLWWKTREGIAQRRRGAEEKEDPEKRVVNSVLPLAVFPLVFPCLYYFTHADLRYRHPIDPVICLLTVVAVAGVWELVAVKTKGNAQTQIGKAASSRRTPKSSQ
jgi:hypothetical protein